ncbi:MAG: exodeoxyribonuclease subunit beta [Pseudomonadota bacterium]|jgi:exodeoxyribonuclease V beta subunit
MAFNPVSTPLEGINLIEASAGTGKTYTIATLVVRLLIENGLNINQILVVTFTEAATTELKDRIGKRLEQMRQIFSIILEKDIPITYEKDETLFEIAKNHPEPQLALEKINSAIYGFDEAAIYTIHSFCRKTLQEFAFESGALFDTELVSNQTAILEEIAQDFWRKNLYQENPFFLDYLISQKFTLENLVSLLNKPSWYTNWDSLKLVPRVSLKTLPFSEETYIVQYQKVQILWQQFQSDIADRLFSAIKNNYLDGRVYQEKRLINWLKELDLFFKGNKTTPILPEKFQNFTINELNRNAKNKTFDHVFFGESQILFDQANALLNHYQQQILQLKHRLLHYANVEFKTRQQQQHIQSFDDLLLDLFHALRKSKAREKLINVINYKYKAALIDEFQDTDNLQYTIFHELFKEKCLFFIGDPKQAIYGFRGADIFSYIEASKQAQERIYSLSTNYRSTPSLIKATNTIFQRHSTPFYLKDIHFSNAIPREQNLTTYQPALHIYFLERQHQQETMNKASGKKNIAYFIANKISNLLNEGDFTAGDMAILVRKNKEAHLLQKILQHYKIPAVLYSHENIFTSDEAIAIKYLLAALLEITNETAVKTALISDLFELNAVQIFLLSQDEQRWSFYLEYFQFYAQLWEQKGFMPMFRHLLFSGDQLFQKKLISHLLSFPNGERKLTNFLHLSEILHTVEKQQHFGMYELYKWLVEKISYLDKEEEHELRLESDEKAVKLVTIHKSKGLEYPIVFLPFIWDGHLQIKDTSKEFILHDPNENNALTLVLDSKKKEDTLYKNQAILEEQAENARLLYVALTRAKVACHAVFGVFKEVENAAWTYLLFQNQKNLSKQSDQNLFYTLEELVEQSQQTIALSKITYQKRTTTFQMDKEQLSEYNVRKVSKKLKKNWFINSFSGLSGQMQIAEDQIDNRAQRLDTDIIEQLVSENSEEISTQMDDIFHLPAGSKIGNLLHEILEHLDFQKLDSTLIQHKMAFHHFDLKYQPTVEKLLENVLQSRLNGDFCLAEISVSQRLNEMEFYYPVDELVSQKMNGLLIPYWEQRWNISFKKPFFQTWQGFMRGFIDLIFEHNGQYFLVDYKSNRLGFDLKDYAPDKLAFAMEEHHYFLQYHIYSVALHRYLTQRLPNYHYEKHFGGVFYLFLRGMRPDSPQNGIFYDKPDADFIMKFSDLFSSKIA